MFNNPRYLTRGVNSTIPIELQIFMWQCIDNLKVKKDYFQVFNLSVVNGIQRVEHKQEVPEYQNTYSILVANPVDAKVFIIDEGNYTTMLLAEEY